MVWVKVGGYALPSIGHAAELTWSNRADGGCFEASWEMDLPVNFAHPAIRRGQRVTISEGSYPVWTGTLTEPNLAEGTFHAEGLSRQAEGAAALGGTGNPGTAPDVVIDAGIARGQLAWTRPASISSDPFNASYGNLNDIAAVLDAYAQQEGQRWGVDAQGRVYSEVDPTVPSWQVVPGVAQLGLADDEFATHLYGRYIASGPTYVTATASDDAAAARWGRREHLVDLTPLGVIAAGKAANILAGMLARGKARTGWTNGVEVSPQQITTMGGTPAHLPLIKAGQMVRLHGILGHGITAKPYLDFVIGETRYTAGDDVILLNPVDLAPRNLADVLTAAGSTSGGMRG